MRFSLRSLFILVTCSAIAGSVIWLATGEYRRQLGVRQDLESIGASWVGFVSADGKYQTSVVFGDSISGALVGDANIERIELKGFDVSVEDVQHITSVESVAHLMFVSCDLSASDVKPLADMQQIQELLFWNVAINDEVIETIVSIKGLERVAFKNTAVTKRGAESITALRPDLEVIHVP
ncbi:MAG: hypothetical protein AAGG48_23900 [Planctomycetota bacterium]